MKNNLVKIVTTIPESNTSEFLKTIGDAGAGKIGNYTHCSFVSKGIGRSLPTTGANPTIGQIGRFEEIVEDRIEFTCNKELLAEIVKLIKSIHPYEEPVIDIYQLLDV